MTYSRLALLLAALLLAEMVVIAVGVLIPVTVLVVVAAADQGGTTLTVDAAYVSDKVAGLASHADLRKFIL